MHIALVRLNNILGIESLEFKAGSFVQIEGPNGSGKTSVLEGLRAVVKGGHDATLIRNGHEKGEAVIVLDDGVEFRRRVTDKGSYLTVTNADGTRDPKAAERAKALVDLLSMNPIEFLNAKPEKRVDALLESLPLKADVARLKTIVGGEIKVDANQHALVQIDTLYDAVFGERRETNRAIKEKESSINQLAATLPSETDVPTDDVAELEAQLAKVNADEEVEMNRIATRLQGFRDDSGAKIEAETKAIEALREQIANHQETIGAERRAFAEIEERANAQRAKKRDQFGAERGQVQAKLAAIRASTETAAKARTTREIIKGLRGEADTLIEDQERQNKALDALKAYKVELLNALPIDGLEVRDGDIYRHGVIFNRLNTAQQVEIGVEVAKLRAGDLGVICVDGLESLDTAHFEAFRDMAIKSNLQLFVTKVSDEPFSIKSDA